MDYNNTPISNEEMMYRNIERQIKNNQFSSKEELNQYIVNSKNNGTLNLPNERIRDLLDLYDDLSNINEMPLNTEKYKSVGLENQNLIVSTENDKVLKTLESSSAMAEEFKHTQNIITANNQDGLANADTVFNHMANNQKEELVLIPISDIHKHDIIDMEILRKIKFFITNKYVNPHDYRVDIQSGIFYNIETSEVLEVRKNNETNQYEIYRGSEKVYGNIQNEEQMPEEEKEEEKMLYESRNKPKVRKLTLMPKNRAAFTKVSFLIINILTFAIMTTMIYLLNK